MKGLAIPVVAVLAIVPLLSGCFGPPPVLASSEVTQAAMTLEKPPADRARIFVFTGRGPLFTGGTTPQVSHYLAADIYVDDVKIGTVNPKEAMVFDVAAGKHSFAWMIYNVKPGPGFRMQPSQVDLPGGVIVGISAEYAGTTYFMSEGVMNSLFDKRDPKRLSPDIKIVRPAFCPPTLCL